MRKFSRYKIQTIQLKYYSKSKQKRSSFVVDIKKQDSTMTTN